MGKSLDHLEYLVENESEFTRQMELSQTYSRELRRMKKSAVRFETVNYEAVEVENFDSQLLTEDSSRKYLDDDLCKTSPIACEPGNEGSDDDEPGWLWKTNSYISLFCVFSVPNSLW